MNERLIILPTAKKGYFDFYFLVRVSKTSAFCANAPFASTGISPVVNWLNHGTTVYYGLVFSAFSWPYMVKWHNSGIIKGVFGIYCGHFCLNLAISAKYNIFNKVQTSDEEPS